MIETCCNCFAGRIVKSVCNACGHSFKRTANDNAPTRYKPPRERLPNQHEQKKLRKAVYKSTGADVFNGSIKA